MLRSYEVSHVILVMVRCNRRQSSVTEIHSHAGKEDQEDAKRMNALSFVPVPQAQWKVLLAHISRWVHAGKKTEVRMTYQRF